MWTENLHSHGHREAALVRGDRRDVVDLHERQRSQSAASHSRRESSASVRSHLVLPGSPASAPEQSSSVRGHFVTMSRKHPMVRISEVTRSLDCQQDSLDRGKPSPAEGARPATSDRSDGHLPECGSGSATRSSPGRWPGSPSAVRSIQKRGSPTGDPAHLAIPPEQAATAQSAPTPDPSAGHGDQVS